jgi:GT2 family glycosyltransferase
LIVSLGVPTLRVVISAVVINWNGKHYLEACIGSLLAQDPPPDEIVLVDNHSDDGSREFVEATFASVRVVDTGYNAGPGYARNMGVASARHARVLLIDNDVTMQPGALASLAATMDGNPGVAVVQARSVIGSDPDVVHYDGTEIHFLGLLVLHNWFTPLAAAAPPPRPNGGLVALCFLADRGKYLDSGGFNSDLFILFEDTDLAWRLRMRGERILLDERALVAHGAGTKDVSMRGAGAKYPARRIYLHSRNRWLVLLTCLHWRSLVFLAPPQLAYECVQFLFALAKLHPIAWCHGKVDLIRYLPRAFRWRHAAQATRTVADRELLVAGAFTLNPGLSDRGPSRVLHACMARCSTLWWKLFGRLCG